MKIDTKWVVVILLVLGGLLYAQHWAGMGYYESRGPDVLAKDQQGNLYIKVKSTILRYGPDGSYKDQRDLNSIGVETLIGGISFFPNGDLLMVPVSYSPSLLEKISIAFRITRELPGMVKGTEGQLSRCSWDNLQCQPLTGFQVRFNRAFWAYIDEDENIFLADTSRHRIFWLDKNGRELDVLQDPAKIQFPNQILRQGEHLWFANCNDNSLTKVALGDGQVGRDLTRYPASASELPKGDRWPTGVVVMDGDFYVLAQGDNLTRGSIYRVNATGEIQQVFVKPRGSDFIAIASFNGNILAADFTNLSVHIYGRYGDDLGLFSTAELDTVIQALKEKQQRFSRIELFFKLLFWGSMLSGFGAAILFERHHKRDQALSANKKIAEVVHAGNLPPSIDDKRIQWIGYSFWLRGINKWAIWFWLPFILLSIPALLSAEEESVFGASAFLLIHCFVLLKLIHAARLANRKLGVLVPWVMLQDGHGNLATAREVEVLSYKIFNRVILMVGNDEILVKARGNMFDGKLANEYVARLVAIAQPLSLVERWRWILDHRLTNLLRECFLLLLYIIILLAINLHR